MHGNAIIPEILQISDSSVRYYVACASTAFKCLVVYSATITLVD